MQSSTWRAILALWFVCACFAGNAQAAGSPFPQSDQDALFNQAVQAYQQNQFTPALEKFQQVTGAHAAEAQQYVARIKAYKEAMSVAKGILERSADERDARSLEYAIGQLEEALKIKPDGPWQPQQQLEKARQQKEEFEKTHAERSKAADVRFCQQAVAAAQEHRFKEAAEFSCLLADDNPGYNCGGDEAVHLCETNTELSKMDKGDTGSPKVAASLPASSSALDKAKAAYDGNQFERARGMFQKIGGDAKPAADEFLDKISRYDDSFANAEKLGRDGKYDQAKAAFLAAATIKPDGPGNPQSRASRMELLLGLDQFYSGDYVSATQHLQACAGTETGKQSLVHFYLGASKLARFFVTGSDDSALRDDALNDFKLAKQGGFKTSGQDVSPKIRQVYETLSF